MFYVSKVCKKLFTLSVRKLDLSKWGTYVVKFIKTIVECRRIPGSNHNRKYQIYWKEIRYVLHEFKTTLFTFYGLLISSRLCVSHYVDHFINMLIIPAFMIRYHIKPGLAIAVILCRHNYIHRIQVPLGMVSYWHERTWSP